jgi:hypothetical protein
MPGHMYVCHTGARCYWNPVCRWQGAVACPAVHRTVSTTKTYLVQNGSGSQVWWCTLVILAFLVVGAGGLSVPGQSGQS